MHEGLEPEGIAGRGASHVGHQASYVVVIQQCAHDRLHQPLFAGQVMTAYRTSCAVCALRHRELLDAAHTVADCDSDGLPVVSNGLALCKIHHAAYDPRHPAGLRR